MTSVCSPSGNALTLQQRYAGFAFTTPSNGEAIWTQALPIVNGETKGVGGRFVSDAGGTVPGEVAASCLE